MPTRPARAQLALPDPERSQILDPRRVRRAGSARADQRGRSSHGLPLRNATVRCAGPGYPPFWATLSVSRHRPGRQAASARRGQRHHRAARPQRVADLPGRARSADRPGQPARVRPPARRWRSTASTPAGRRRAAVLRPRPVQDHQRHLRPPCRRPVAGAAGGDARQSPGAKARRWPGWAATSSASCWSRRRASARWSSPSACAWRSTASCSARSSAPTRSASASGWSCSTGRA